MCFVVNTIYSDGVQTTQFKTDYFGLFYCWKFIIIDFVLCTPSSSWYKEFK